MIRKLLNFIRQAREKAQHNEAKDRGPVPPVRRTTKPKTKPISQRSAPKRPVKAPPGVARSTVPKLAQRGAGKNVMVLAGVNEDPDAALERLDRTSASIELEVAPPTSDKSAKGGFDPYNSGVFDSKKVWDNSKRP